MSESLRRWIAVVECGLVLILWCLWSIGFLKILLARYVAWTCIPAWANLDYGLVNGAVRDYPYNQAVDQWLPILFFICVALIYALRKSPAELRRANHAATLLAKQDGRSEC